MRTGRHKTKLAKLLEKNMMKVIETSFVYSLELDFKESFKKKFLNGLYFLLSRITDRFIETLVIIAEPVDDNWTTQ